MIDSSNQRNLAASEPQVKPVTALASLFRVQVPEGSEADGKEMEARNEPAE